MTKVKTDSALLEESARTDKTVSFIRFPKGIQREIEVPSIDNVATGEIIDPIPAPPNGDGDGDGNKGGEPPVVLDGNGNPIVTDPEDKTKKPEGDDGDKGGEPKAAAYLDGDDVVVDFDRVDDLIFDDKGNLLDKEGGSVMLSKEEYETTLAANPPSDEDTALAVVQTAVGVEVMGENGKPKTYEQTADGIQAYINDATEIRVAEQVRTEQDAFLNSNPHLKAYANHLQKGGDPRSFHEDVSSWKDVEIDKNSNEQHMDIVKSNLMRNGYSEDRATKMAKTLVDGGDGLVEANTALAELRAADQTERDEAVASQVEAQKEIQAKTDKYWNDIETSVKGRTLGSNDATIKIPEGEVNGFLSYLTKPVDKEGYTQEQLDRSAEGMNDALLGAYLKYKNYNFANMIDLKAKSRNVVRIGQMANKASKAGSNAVVVRRNKGNVHNMPSIDDLT